MNRLRKRSLMHAMLGAAAAWGLTFGAVTPVHAVWSEYAFISSTMGVSDSRICIGEASRGEIGCPSYAPTISPTGRINASAGLTVDSVSLTTTGTTWGYLGSNASYIPNLNTNNISLSTINGISVTNLGGSSPTNVPAFIAHRNGVNQTGVATNTWTKVNLPNEDYDNYNAFNTSTGRFQPTVAGNYLITAGIACPSAGSCYASIFKNGVSLYQSGHSQSPAGQIFATTSGVVQLNGTTDYIELWGYTDGGTFNGGPLRVTGLTGSLLASGNGLVSGTGATALNGLTDVTLSSPATGQVLTYNGTRWVNATPSATTVISGTTSMLSGWPDAIMCYNSSLPIPFYLSSRATSSTLLYRPFNAPTEANDYKIYFNNDGSYNTSVGTFPGDCVSKSITQLYAEGRAFNFIGNSGAGGALGDRLTSGTLAVTANSATSIISLTTNGTTWGYLGSNSSYLPTINTSAISATAVQISSNTAVVCGIGNAGTLRYNSSNTALELCTGTSWQMMGVGIPAGTISAFASTTCPTGWSEYTPARGRFLRGIDNGAGNDPDGTRAPGSIQQDDIKALPQVWLWQGSETFDGYGPGASYHGRGSTQAQPTSWPTGLETRPKNVAVTYCQFNGTSNGWNNPLSGGSTVPGGNTGQIQFNSAGAFAGSAGLTFDNATSRLTATNISATALTVNGVAITGSSSGDRIASGTTSAIATPSGTIDISGSVNVSGSIKLDNLAVACTADKVGSIAIINGRLSQCRL